MCQVFPLPLLLTLFIFCILWGCVIAQYFLFGLLSTIKYTRKYHVPSVQNLAVREKNGLMDIQKDIKVVYWIVDTASQVEETLTDVFSCMEIVYMNPHIFSSGNELIPKLWFQWCRFHTAGHVITLHQSKTEKPKFQQIRSEQTSHEGSQCSLQGKKTANLKLIEYLSRKQ